MYRLRYYADFKDNDNNSLRLEIYIDRSTAVTSTEIKLLHDAITIEYSAESLFEPLKTSRASISILTEDLMTDLYSGGLFGTAIKILKNNSLFWTGYATPCIYQQSYVGKWDVLTLECVDSVSQLQNIDYTNATNADSGIASFFNVIAHCLTLVDPLHAVTNLYVDNSITLGSNQPIFDALHIKERNFFDEKNEPEKLDEVVSAILRYLGLTLIQWKYNYYIIGQEKMQQSFGVRLYHYSNGAWSSNSTGTITVTSKSFSQIGLAADDTTISLDNVFNKVTVIANNNPLSSVLPDFDDDEDLINQSSNPDYQTESYVGIDGTNYTLVSGFYKSVDNWNYATPNIYGTAVSEVTIYNRDSLTGGVFWQKVFDYETGYEPSSPDAHTYITFVGDSALSNFSPMLTLNKTQSMILDGGYLIVNLKYKLSTEKKAHSVVTSKYDSATFGYCNDLMWTSNTDIIGYDNWPYNTNFPCRITIGGYYYNGETWISYSEFNAKVARGYYSFGSNNIHGYALHGGPGTTHKEGDWENWYRIKNSYGDWLYVTKSVWQSNTGLKESGKTKRNNHFYYINGNGEHVAMCIDYYYEIALQDRFYLTHINKTTEAIFDAEYSVNLHSVSYKMNIVDASDGVAIPCLTNVSMYGRLTFELYAPNVLGTMIQGRGATCRAVHISDLSIQYKKSTEFRDLFSTAKVDPDTLYQNTVNGSYCKELDDVTLKVNTANDWATSYSYAIAQSGNDYYYIKGVRFDGVEKKPEERLVERLVNHYKTPKYKMTSTVHDTVNVQPFHPITETINGQTKQMVANSVTYHINANTATIEANEI